MSRHSLPTNTEYTDCWVVVGWDRPLTTFFAQVFRRASKPNEDDDEILWIGASRGEIPDVETIKHAVTPYATLSREIARQLQIDRLCGN